ncbi:MFS transporter [Pontibacter sp. G13]|uniref:MFS transporter n=1 Tax=Pontibacter sp. G13 TaxID=3074898 RepID=UPI00288A0CF3|nr:MFS transporter [Pontibacter sp. G13]WNJ21300.1 MFS transporter [Pontibacter sp. G13]
MNYLQLLRRYPHYLAYGLLHYFFSGPGQTFFISLYVPYFLMDLSLDNETFQMIYSVSTLASAFTLPFVGKWIDEWKLRNFSVVLGIALLGFCVAAALIHSVYLLPVVLFGLRLCGQGLMGLTASTAIARYFEETRGKALSLVGFGVSIAEITLPIVVAMLMTDLGLGWRETWLGMALLVGLVFIPMVIALVPSDSPFQYNRETESHQVDADAGASRSEVLRDPKFYLLTLVYLMVPFFMTGMIINKHMMGESAGWDEAQLAIGLSVFGAFRLVNNLVAGPLVDKFTATKVFAFQLIPMVLGCLVIAWTDQVMGLWIFFGLCGISASLGSLTTTAMWAEIYGTTHLGAIRSMVSTFMVFSTGVAPIIFSWALGAHFGTVPTMWVCVGAFSLLTVLGFVLVKTIPIRTK